MPLVALFFFMTNILNAQHGPLSTITVDNNLPLEPCKPFIGVQLNVKNPVAEGIGIERIIPNSPAMEADLQVGDIIIAFDHFDVNSPCELTGERDQKYPGDDFTLTYVRNGQTYNVDATFPSCEELGKPEMTTPSNQLVLSDFQAFPNPTEGITNIYFEGKAEPITIQVTDLLGREVFKEEVNNFDGVYNQQVDLSQNAAGTYLINIRQKQQFFTDKIILKRD